MASPTLNAEQNVAASLPFDRPALILATAGSGKTLTICHRVARMVASGIPARSILALTFTNKAAAEMRTRTRVLLPPTSQNEVEVTTFHGWALLFLRRYGHLLGYRTESLTIFEKPKLLLLVRDAIQKVKDKMKKSELEETGGRQKTLLQYFQPVGSSSKPPSIEAASSSMSSSLSADRLSSLGSHQVVSHGDDGAAEDIDVSESMNAKEMLDVIQKVKDSSSRGFQAMLAKPYLHEVYSEYQRLLQRCNAVDFPDLLQLTLKLLRYVKSKLWEESSTGMSSDWAKIQQWQASLRLIVDEFQDTNLLQMELVLELVGSSGWITAVGDANQAIYGWRGSSTRVFAVLSSHFPTMATVHLQKNYRSTQQIIDCCAFFLKDASEKAFAPSSAEEASTLLDLHQHVPTTSSDTVTVVSCHSPRVEAAWISTTINAMRIRRRLHFRDFAVLLRTGMACVLTDLEELFQKFRIPYMIAGKQMLERGVVQDVLAYLTLVINSADDVAFQRILGVPIHNLNSPKVLKAITEIADGPHIPCLEGCRGCTGCSLWCAARRGLRCGQLMGIGTSRCKALQNLIDLVQGFSSEWSSSPCSTVTSAIRRVLMDTRYITCVEGDGPLTLRKATAKWLTDASGSTPLPEPHPSDGSRLASVIYLIAEAQAWDRGMRAAQNGLEHLAGFLQNMSLQSESRNVPVDAVTISTIHRAKGCEWPVVFLARCNKGIFPAVRSQRQKRMQHFATPYNALNEEHRLMYVAMSRARQFLFLTYVLFDKNAERTAMQPQYPSPFLGHIPAFMTRGLNVRFDPLRHKKRNRRGKPTSLQSSANMFIITERPSDVPANLLSGAPRNNKQPRNTPPASLASTSSGHVAPSVLTTEVTHPGSDDYLHIAFGGQEKPALSAITQKSMFVRQPCTMRRPLDPIHPNMSTAEEQCTHTAQRQNNGSKLGNVPCDLKGAGNTPISVPFGLASTSAIQRIPSSLPRIPSLKRQQQPSESTTSKRQCPHNKCPTLATGKTVLHVMFKQAAMAETSSTIAEQPKKEMFLIEGTPVWVTWD